MRQTHYPTIYNTHLPHEDVQDQWPREPLSWVCRREESAHDMNRNPGSVALDGTVKRFPVRSSKANW